jgi:hypothetical protein
LLVSLLGSHRLPHGVHLRELRRVVLVHQWAERRGRSGDIAAEWRERGGVTGFGGGVVVVV